MNREQKTIAVSILTVFLLGLSNYMQKGSFIFTFPINELLFLTVSIYFAWFNFRENKSIYVLVLALALAELLSEQYNLEFILNTDQLRFYDTYGIGDWFKLLAQFLLTIIAFLFLKNTGWKYYPLWFLLFLAPIVLSITYHIPFLIHLSLLQITVMMGLCKSSKENGYRSIFLLFVLLNVLHLTKAIYLDFI